MIGLSTIAIFDPSLAQFVFRSPIYKTFNEGMFSNAYAFADLRRVGHELRRAVELVMRTLKQPGS